MTEVKLHVESLERFFGRARETARRIDRGARDEAAAHISFGSMEELLEVLTPNRWRLLRALRLKGPVSIRQLARQLGRDYRGVHSDVTRLIDEDLVERDSQGLLLVPWTRITAEMDIEAAA